MKTAAQMIREVSTWLHGAEEKEKQLFLVLMLETLTRSTPRVTGFERVINNAHLMMAQLRERYKSTEKAKKRSAQARANVLKRWENKEQRSAAERQSRNEF